MSGFAYNFEVYTGLENNDDIRDLHEPDFRAAGNTVVRLARITSRDKNHKLYFDNFYNSVPLCNYLLSQGIQSVGTVHLNRIADCKLPKSEDQKKKKMKRGESVVCGFHCQWRFIFFDLERQQMCFSAF